MSGFAGFRLALGLLTIVPVKPPTTIGRPVARTAMLLAPLAVFPVALVAGLIGGAVAQVLPAALAGAIAVAVVAFGTRAMHLDGLADTVDGLGSGKDAVGALEIMRRGDIGPMGTVALVLALLIQSLAAGALLARPSGWVGVVVVLCCSRAALALGCARPVPAARPGGLGALVAGSVPGSAVVGLWLIVLLVLQAAGAVLGCPVWLPLTAVGAVLLASVWLLQRCTVRLGGITGDVLGALVEVAATVMLVVAAIG